MRSLVTYFDFTFILRKGQKFRVHSELTCFLKSCLLNKGEEICSCKAFLTAKVLDFQFPVQNHVPLSQGRVLHYYDHNTMTMKSLCKILMKTLGLLFVRSFCTKPSAGYYRIWSPWDISAVNINELLTAFKKFGYHLVWYLGFFVCLLCF